MISNSKANRIRMNWSQFSGSAMKREKDVITFLLHYTNTFFKWKFKSHHQVTINITQSIFRSVTKSIFWILTSHFNVPFFALQSHLWPIPRHRRKQQRQLCGPSAAGHHLGKQPPRVRRLLRHRVREVRPTTKTQKSAKWSRRPHFAFWLSGTSSRSRATCPSWGIRRSTWPPRKSSASPWRIWPTWAK